MESTWTARCDLGRVTEIHLTGRAGPGRARLGENKECPEFLPPPPPAALLLSLPHRPYKDRCDRLPAPCLINIVLPCSLTLLFRTFCPVSLALYAFIGDGSDKDAREGENTAKTNPNQRNPDESTGTEVKR